MVITCTMENKVQIWTLPTLDIDASQTFDLRSAQGELKCNRNERLFKSA